MNPFVNLLAICACLNPDSHRDSLQNRKQL